MIHTVSDRKKEKSERVKGREIKGGREKERGRERVEFEMKWNELIMTWINRTAANEDIKCSDQELFGAFLSISRVTFLNTRKIFLLAHNCCRHAEIRFWILNTVKKILDASGLTTLNVIKLVFVVLDGFN